jgi:hypothetical protein
MSSDGPLLLDLDYAEKETNKANIGDQIVSNQQPTLIGHAVKKNGHLKHSRDQEDQESVISLSNSSTEEICLVPEVQFEGITLDSGIDRESQPLLGGREHEISCNQFPGESDGGLIEKSVCIVTKRISRSSLYVYT